MTNILPNESQNLLTANTIWQALKLWWLYYPVDTTLAKYSSKDYFPSLCIQAGTEEISEAQKNDAPNIPAHLFGAFFQQMHCPCKLKKNTNQKTIKNTKIQQIIHTVCTGSSFSLPLPSVQFHSAGNKRKSQQHSATLLLGSWSSQETRASKWTHIGDVVF